MWAGVNSSPQGSAFIAGSGYNYEVEHAGPFIPTKSRAQVCNTSTLKCAACLFAKASTKSPVNLAPRASPKNHILKQDHLQPGNRISADHYFSSILGRLPHTFGKERNGYTCGSLFVDHASGKIFNFPQYSNTASETIRSTLCLEAMALDKGFTIKRYHSDNGIFASAEFKQHCALQHQTYSFSGVGAKHQNGVAERNIKTVAEWAQANMLHLATHWPQFASSKYWLQAIAYAVWVFNRLPNIESGIAPNKVWSSVHYPSSELLQAHVLGAQFMYLTHLFKMERKYQNETLPTSWILPWILRFALISSPVSDEHGNRENIPSIPHNF